MKPENIELYEDAVKAGLPVFKVLSDGAVKGYMGEDGKRRFTLIASSNATDLVNDVMTPKALEKMKSAAEGTTMFMNHKYSVPEDVFGAVEKASLVRREVQVNGEPQSLLCLDYSGIVEESNPRAVALHDIMVGNRVKMGASVSVLIYDTVEEKTGRRLIEDIHYLEASIVGIPCNPTCWVTSASKALNLKREAALPAGQEVDMSTLTKKAPEVVAPAPSHKELAEAVEDAVADAFEHKGVIGSTSLPLADRNRAWAAGPAKKRMRAAAGGDKPNSKYKRGFFWFDSAAPDNWGSYKLPFADVLGGTLKAVPRGVFAVAGVIQGARGGANIPDADAGKIKTKVNAYYSRMRSEFADDTIIPPWDKKHYDFRSNFYAKLFDPAAELEGECPHCHSKDFELTELVKPVGYVSAEQPGTTEVEVWARCLQCKGMFQEMMDRRGLSFDYCVGIFCDCLWELREEKWEGESTDTLAAELEIAIDEFTDCLRENAPKWLGIYPLAEEAEKVISERLALVKHFSEAILKAGARNNQQDQMMIQNIHDMATELGAACDGDENKSVDSATPDAKTAAQAPEDPKVAALTSELDAAKKSIADLTASSKAKDTEIERWKAASLYAAGELDRMARIPLPRAGQR